MEASIIEPTCEKIFGYAYPKDIKIGIDGLMGNFSDRETSHKASWAYMLKNQIKSLGYSNVEVLHKNKSWDDFDVMVIDWGMEFKGVFNVFGGASDEIYERLQQLLRFNKKQKILNHSNLVSAHRPFPDVAGFVSGRLKTGTKLFKTLNPEDFKGIKSLHFDHVFKSDKVCFGDSHILSAYHPGYMIFRNDGLTLHGALNRKIKTLIPSWTKQLVVYLGNIDVRHHLCRQQNPEVAMKVLALDYQTQLLTLQDDGIDIKVIGLLPIEHEDRKLPKTGYYEGTPFAGSRENRTYLKEWFNEIMKMACHKYNWTFQGWPEEWHQMDPKDYAEIHMEKPKSVHIRRSSYLFDWETGRKRF